MLSGPPPVVGMTLPSPRYLEHYPQYVPQDLAFPVLPRELPSQCRCVRLRAPLVRQPRRGRWSAS